MDDSSDYCRELFLIGRTGNGKSCLGNSILGREAFAAEELSIDSVTEMFQQESDNATYVIDTPGLFDTKNSLTDTSLEILSALNECPNPHAFIMVFNAKNRMANEEKVTVNLLRIILGEACFSNMIVVFTHVDENVSDSDFKSFWHRDIWMTQFIEKCGGRVSRIDNRNPAKEKRVLEILRLVDTVSKYGKNSFNHSNKTKVENALKNHKANNEAMQTNIPNCQFSEDDVYGSEIKNIVKALVSYLRLSADNQTYQPVENQTDQTVANPTAHPVANSTVQVSANPTVQPGADPTVQPSADPTDSSSWVTYMFGLACVVVGIGCPAGVVICITNGKIAGCIITGISACVGVGVNYYLPDKTAELMKTFKTFCQSIPRLGNVFCCCS